MGQIVFWIIVIILVGNFLLERTLSYLNLKHMSPVMPKEAEGIYDEEKYRKSQQYQCESSRFGMISSVFSFLLIIGMLFLYGFAFVDDVARSFTEHPILMPLLFFGILSVASDIISIPFEIYDTFVIEEKFGFNKTTLRTYIFDKLKGWLLSAIIGGGLFALFIWFYHAAGSYFWIWMWLVAAVFMIFMTMFYTTLIVPIFNKLTALPDGELRSAIEAYAKKEGFELTNIFVIDGSKRSSKANAYFSGLGPKKTIVLYDTLIEKHSTEELVAVLAHEVGHYKKKHVFSGMIFSLLQMGVMLFLLSLFINSPQLSMALGGEGASFHLGLLAFSLLYSPLGLLLGIFMNVKSRKNEFEADDFAKNTFNGKALSDALKKLSADNLSNLTPHPAYVFFYYSHPPLLERLKALQ
jgi:STE24 endopeptidase